MSKKGKNNKYKTLLSVLAHGSTEQAQQLLEKNTGSKAKNYNDLEYRLAQFYANSPDKVQLEKEFAEIHPHKDFILKYLAPPKLVEEDKPIIQEVTLKDQFSSCEGNPDCNCNKATEKMQGFVGSQPINEVQSKSNDNMIIGVIGLVAILGLVVIYKK